MVKNLILFSLVSLSFNAQAGDEFKFHQKTFPLISPNQCQIERFTVINKRSEIRDETSNAHFTSMAAVIETTKPECIRKYAVVQWLKGCVTDQVFRKSTGELSPKYFGTSRESRGKVIAFNHPHWEVDTLDVDPMYQNNEEKGDRLDWYYVTKRPLKLNNDLQTLISNDLILDNSKNFSFLQYLTKKIPKQTFITDMPTMASTFTQKAYDTMTVTTPSLEFQVCVYETKDIPLTGNPAVPGTAPELGGPLQCYYWDHKFNFNTRTLDFERVTSPGVDSFCK